MGMMGVLLMGSIVGKRIVRRLSVIHAKAIQIRFTVGVTKLLKGIFRMNSISISESHLFYSIEYYTVVRISKCT